MNKCEVLRYLIEVGFNISLHSTFYMLAETIKLWKSLTKVGMKCGMDERINSKCSV